MVVDLTQLLRHYLVAILKHCFVKLKFNVAILNTQVTFQCIGGQPREFLSKNKLSRAWIAW